MRFFFLQFEKKNFFSRSEKTNRILTHALRLESFFFKNWCSLTVKKNVPFGSIINKIVVLLLFVFNQYCGLEIKFLWFLKILNNVVWIWKFHDFWNFISSKHMKLENSKTSIIKKYFQSRAQCASNRKKMGYLEDVYILLVLQSHQLFL